MIQWVRNLFTKTLGTFVDVHLDYEFRAFEPGVEGATKGPFPHTLHILDLPKNLAEKALDGKRFDWHLIHSHWRHNLELKGFHAAKWEDMQKYLRGE